MFLALKKAFPRIHSSTIKIIFVPFPKNIFKKFESVEKASFSQMIADSLQIITDSLEDNL